MKLTRARDSLTFADTGRRHLAWGAVCLAAIAIITTNVGDLTIFIGEEAVPLIPRVVFILPLIAPFLIALAHAAYAWNPREVSFDQATQRVSVRSRRVHRAEERTASFDDIAQVLSRESLTSTKTIVILTSGEEILIDRQERVDTATRASAQAQVELITSLLTKERTRAPHERARLRT